MERCAVFVDAGWFLSETAQALTGRGSRWSIKCDYAKLTLAIGQLAQQNSQLPLLRIYWYDAAADGVPSLEHLEIAPLKDVKLRLGRISHSQQKGVDSLLLLDLTTLARERAISSALVVSGDEDIREGIASAQSLGVRVTIAGVAMVEGRPSLATTLIHEADDHFLIDLGMLSRYVRVQHGLLHEAYPSEAPSPVDQDAASEPAPADHAERATATANGGVSAPRHEGQSPRRGGWSPRQFGHDFGAAYADKLTDPQLRMLQREAPEMPGDVAAQLFRDAEQVFGETRGRPELRRELRMGFWDHVMQRRNS